MRWLVMVLAVWPTVVAADGVTSVKAKLIGDAIALTVTYQVKPSDPGVRRLDLDLPAEAVITGATVTAGGKTQKLALSSASQVEASLDELTRERGGSEKDTRWAFAIQGNLYAPAFVYAVPKAGTVKLALEVVSPACWYKGARYAVVPKTWVAKVLVKQRVTTEPACAVAAGEDEAWISIAAKEPTQPFVVTGTSVEAGDQRFAAIEVVLASKLTTVPNDLATVLVVDGSRSMTKEQLAAQRALVASYLKEVATTQVQVVTFAREAKPLLAKWSKARDVDARIDLALEQLVPANGSAIDSAIGEAATWLGQAKGTKRVVVFTDDLFALSVTKQISTLAAKLPAGTTVHVVKVADGPLESGNRLALEPLATATNGRTLVGSGDATMLTRSVSLDAIKFEGEGWNVDHMTCAPIQAEGTSCTLLATSRRGAGALALTGMLGSEPVRVPIELDTKHPTAAARRFLSGVFDGDSHAASLRTQSEAVTPETWLYGARGAPSSYGDGWATIGTGRYSTTCKDCAAPAQQYSGVRKTPGPYTKLVKQLELATDACRDKTAVDVVVDVTGLEIADVSVPASVPDQQKRCIETALWGASLTPYPKVATSPVMLRILPLQ
jgi:Mg-chelatase subunit ChlD